MRRRLWPAAGAALVAITLAACGGEEAPEAELAPAADGAPAVSAPVPPADPAAQSGAPATGVALGVAQSQEHGAYLADASGRAVYLLEADSARQSTCYDACAQAWPPLIATQGTSTAADPAVQASMIGTVQRRDGSSQVTYNGHPLYYYAKDAGPGQATGQDVTDQWGEWYLLTPQGTKLDDHGGGSHS